MLAITEFINNTANWQEILSLEPYYIKIAPSRQDPRYFTLKYTLGASDMSIELVRQCRGSIFYDTGSGYECVCMPFYKFMNYGEPFADDIDWANITVTEKIDGSLIKFYYHNNMWHIATNGLPNAFECHTDTDDLSFGEVVVKALGNRLEEFTKGLDKNYCYMFELISDHTVVNIEYHDLALYYLSCRNMTTYQEEQLSKDLVSHFSMFGIRYPQVYESKADIEHYIKLVDSYDCTHEGVVVCDKDYHRVKIKGQEYIKLSHLINNHKVVTTKRVVIHILNNDLDDYIAYIHEGQRSSLLKKIDQFKMLLKTMEDNYQETLEYSKGKTRKEVADFVNSRKYLCTEFVFRKLGNSDLTAYEYVTTRMFRCRIIENVDAMASRV